MKRKKVVPGPLGKPQEIYVDRGPAKTRSRSLTKFAAPDVTGKMTTSGGGRMPKKPVSA